MSASIAHTPIEAPIGREGALPTTPAELRELGNQAVVSNNYKRAVHVFTLGVDIASRGMPRNAEGTAAPEALFECNAKSSGELCKLLCNRSMAHLKDGDLDAAVDDGQSAAHCDPTFEKAHMRLVMALEASGADPTVVRAAVERGLVSCPFGKMVSSWLDAAPAATQPPPPHLHTPPAPSPPAPRLRRSYPDTTRASAPYPRPSPPPTTTAAAHHHHHPPSDHHQLLKTFKRVIAEADAEASSAAAAAEEKTPATQASPLDAARRIAQDPSHPQYTIAASDLGAALATGAFGADKDVEEGERYLRIGSEGGDVAAQRNLGLLLIELGRAGEAAAYLQAAAKAGDKQAEGTLAQLQNEAELKTAELKQRLVLMAAAGDVRAEEMLKELSIAA